MELRIKDSEEFVDTDFGRWLVLRIRAKLISNLSKYNWAVLDKYLTDSSKIRRLYNKSYKASDIIIFAANNLVCSGISGEIVISLNKDKFVPAYDRESLDVLARLINYGTLDVKGCPIFTDTFTDFSKNINMYLRLYYDL